jgi:hypothetical protein
MIKQETIKRFKDTVKRLMKKADYNPSGSPFDILVLDIRNTRDRIEYCAYDKMVKLQFGESLRFLGSPIKVIVRVPDRNREVLGGFPRNPHHLDEDDPIANYRGDVYLMYSNNAFPDTLVKGSKGGNGESIFSLGLPVEKIKELILKDRLKDDLELINTWGLMPIECEIIPEIDGIPPETIVPNTTAYLEKIIGKISRTAILSQKDIH